MAKNKNWYVNQDGDITDGSKLIAEPNYISRECHKNAQLMAAAPELLAACESALDKLSLTPFVNLYAEIEQAVNKAKGA